MRNAGPEVARVDDSSHVSTCRQATAKEKERYEIVDVLSEGPCEKEDAARYQGAYRLLQLFLSLSGIGVYWRPTLCELLA